MWRIDERPDRSLSRGRGLSRDAGDFAAQRTIEDERAERNNRGYEREQRTAEGPAPRDADPGQRQHERNEEDSVDAADDPNGERQASEVFQRHCHKEQDEKGRALSERDETKLMKRSQYSMIRYASTPLLMRGGAGSRGRP